MDNPPAFPTHGYDGMTLRDYFAGQALVGQIAACAGETPYPSRDRAAKQAYEYADAMLKARTKKEGE